ncbi:MAG: ribonuclease HII [Acidobacteria bacterium]|nr:ribonuclease HII [Acidobacteriota bacterium]
MSDKQKRLFEIDYPCPVEKYFFGEGFRLIAGTDEVGRGALAGPLVTAAVMLDPVRPIDGIRDSKQIHAPERERLAAEIRRQALAFALDLVDNETIDRVGIVPATRHSMIRSLRKLRIRPELVLIDFIELDTLDIQSVSLIKGDQVSLSIGAASIMAKVFRDRWMKRAAVRYPVYEFEQNKGYGTARHLDLLRLSGPCPLHRITFRPLTGLGKHGFL